MGDRACPHYLMPNHEPLCRRSEKSEVCGVILIVMWEEDERTPSLGARNLSVQAFSDGSRAHKALSSPPDSWKPTSYCLGHKHTYLIRHQLSSRVVDMAFNCIMPSLNSALFCQTKPIFWGSQGSSFCRQSPNFTLKFWRRYSPHHQLALQSKTPFLLV